MTAFLAVNDDVARRGMRMLAAALYYAEDADYDFPGDIYVAGVVHEECFEGVAAREIKRLRTRLRARRFRNFSGRVRYDGGYALLCGAHLDFHWVQALQCDSLYLAATLQCFMK